MEIKRKIYDKMLEWKQTCNGSKALLIEGARRIEKSTIAEAFGKNEYKTFVAIDFNKARHICLRRYFPNFRHFFSAAF